MYAMFVSTTPSTVPIWFTPKDWTGLFTFTLPPVTPSREEPRFPLEEKRYWNKESLSEHYPWTWSLGVFSILKRTTWEVCGKWCQIRPLDLFSFSTRRMIWFLYDPHINQSDSVVYSEYEQINCLLIHSIIEMIRILCLFLENSCSY